MGHPSNKVLENLAKNHASIHANDITVCAPCHLAKQRKIPFPLSKTNSQCIFDLVHMDIWGPLGVSSIHGDPIGHR